MASVLIVLAAVLLLALALVLTRNAIIAARNRVEEAWSGIDVQLKRRHDLVPNLVETVKGHAAHEQRVLEEVRLPRASSSRSRRWLNDNR